MIDAWAVAQEDEPGRSEVCVPKTLSGWRDGIA
jgi:hypothetical protein